MAVPISIRTRPFRWDGGWVHLEDCPNALVPAPLPGGMLDQLATTRQPAGCCVKVAATFLSQGEYDDLVAYLPTLPPAPAAPAAASTWGTRLGAAAAWTTSKASKVKAWAVANRAPLNQRRETTRQKVWREIWPFRF